MRRLTDPSRVSWTGPLIRIGLLAIALFSSSRLRAEFLAGISKVDITDRTVPVNDPCFAKVLLLKNDETTVVLITIDAVAIGGIGRIGNDFLSNVRNDLRGLAAEVIISASHCHGIVRSDLQPLVVQAVKEASRNMIPVRVSVGRGTENRISENRRMFLKDGTQADMRRAYSMPSDEEVVRTGPIDPEIGIVRLHRTDGSPLAIVYQFACHPIMNPPSKGNSADYPAFASKLIEDATGAMAFFLQGCGGDINPIHYKDVSRPADAEPLGYMLGASVLSACRQITPQNDMTLRVHRELIPLPPAADFEVRIAKIETEQKALVASLHPTNINFKTFLPLLLQHKLSPDMPSHYAQGYIDNPKSLEQLDADNKAQLDAYIANLAIMEKLTRLNVNHALLKKHLAESKTTNSTAINAEVCGLRIGAFKLVTFPGEITVQIGLNIKKAAQDPDVYVSGYTNGYIFYTADEQQRRNSGYAQEDCDAIVAPEWQQVFESKALQVIRQLGQ